MSLNRRDFLKTSGGLGAGAILASSPLKLWDYLASGVPIVGADLPSLRRAAPGAFLPYRPDDPSALARALQRCMTDEALRVELLARATVRTWDQRAAELEAFLSRVLR